MTLARTPMLALFALTALSTTAQAEEFALTANVELGSVSSYVWRGDRLTRDFSPTVQPYGELALETESSGTFTLGLWTSRSPAETDPMQEVDPYLSYTLPALGPVELKLGYAAYLYPGLEPVDAMHELSVEATFDLDIVVQPYVGVAVDPFRTEGAYAYGGLSWTRELGSAELEVKLNVGAAGYAGVPAGFQDATLSSAFSLPIGDDGLYLAANAAVAYSGRQDAVYPVAGLAVGFSR